MAAQYFKFRSSDDVMYGWGTREEAREYCAYLNAEQPNDHYKIVPVNDPSLINGIEFDLADELARIRGIS